MECPSCTFQNTPGTQSCVRCATRLDLDAIDFIPPRAAIGRNGRRARAAAHAARYSVMSGLADVGRSLRLPETSGLTWRRLSLAIVPGLPQIRARSAGLRFLGWLVLGCWALMLVLALAMVGTGFSVFLGFACVSVHCFSISLLLTPELQGRTLLFRLVAGVSIYIVVLLGIYWPISLGLRQVAGVLPLNGLRKQPALANEDILLYTGPWTRPSTWSRGDLVVATIGPATFGNAHIREGLNVDRIVGVEGDFVRLEKGVLTINGETPAPEFAPLGSTRDLPDMDLEVPAGTYIVLPTTLQLANQINGAVSNQIISRVAVLVDGEIRGRVILRMRPWTRFGFPRGEQP